uniref:Hydrazine synthase alpha subunit middle domain-containing protein n=1 Tax=Solibacter usitatus (strain Ellin6076) TaxID=234267 RepID=Q01TK9_SOLUE
MRMGAIGLAGLAASLLAAAASESPELPDYLYTAAPRYEPMAWMNGHDRFPAGSSLMLISGTSRRRIAPDFYASADGAVSFDASHILFAGKRTVSAHWQIWEAPRTGGTTRPITPGDADCVRPRYLPDGRVVFTRISPTGSAIEAAPLEGGKSVRLTFAPGWHLTDDVLRDGRILFETAGEIFTVYPDGTGVESLRCDHGRQRTGARQLSTGDVIFTSSGRLARFTSARAEQMSDVTQPDGDIAGPIAEAGPGSWIVAKRLKPAGAFGLFLWSQAAGRLTDLEVSPEMNAVEPTVVAARTPPSEFPSALVPARTTGNLLCLNAKASKTPIGGDVRAVRVFTKGAGDVSVPLGQAAVEADGSFFVEVPADKPLRMELLDAAGRIVRAERDWFWMRPSEQRVCVGCHTGPERAPENKTPAILLKTTTPEKLLGRQP